MRKRMLFTIVIAMIFALSGCYLNREMYRQEDADRIAAKGAEMMQFWLEENMPEAKLETCAAHFAWSRYDGNNYLTDYASSQISLEGETKSFAIHTETGAVYFGMDADTSQKLTRIVEDYFYEALESAGIVPESVEDGYSFGCYVMVPVAGVPWVYALDLGLPAGVGDLEAFVEDPESRLPICVSPPGFTVSDSTDLSVYDLAAIEAMEEEYGLCLSLDIRNSDQQLQKSTKGGVTHAELWEYGNWLEEDGIELYGIVRKRVEERNLDTNVLTASDQRVNPETDLVFERTTYGYRLSLRNKDLYDRLLLIAYPGADILKDDYYRLDEEDYSPGEDLPEDANETFWKERSDGSYMLTDCSEGSGVWLYDGDVLVRKK